MRNAQLLRFDARGFEIGVCGDLQTRVGISMGGSGVYRLDIRKLFGQFEKVSTNAVSNVFQLQKIGVEGPVPQGPVEPGVQLVDHDRRFARIGFEG